MKKHFTLFDLILLAMCAAMGIALKTVISPLSQLIAGSLAVPGGVVAGGFYMAFLVLGRTLTQKSGAATTVGFIQALVVITTGAYGSHGAVTLLTYTAPGLAMDCLFFLLKHWKKPAITSILGGLFANIIGCFAVSWALYDLAWTPLLLAAAVASITGGLGGYVAYLIGDNLGKLGILAQQNHG